MGEQFPDDEEEFQNTLQNGEVICHLANTIKPNSIRRVGVPDDVLPRLTEVLCSWRERTSVRSSVSPVALDAPKWICSA